MGITSTRRASAAGRPARIIASRSSLLQGLRVSGAQRLLKMPFMEGLEPSDEDGDLVIDGQPQNPWDETRLNDRSC